MHLFAANLRESGAAHSLIFESSAESGLNYNTICVFRIIFYRFYTPICVDISCIVCNGGTEEKLALAEIQLRAHCEVTVISAEKRNLYFGFKRFVRLVLSQL